MISIIALIVIVVLAVAVARLVGEHDTALKPGEVERLLKDD